MEKLSLKGLKFETTEIIIKDNIMTITLARPEKKNAMNNVMMNEINYALAYAKQENSIRVVIIAAKGDIFCSGADLSRSESDSNVPKLEDFDDISLSLRHLYKPVICKIQGSVFAGALLIVTNSTHAISVKEATFSAPEIHRGLWPFMVMAGLFRVMPKRQGLDFIMRGNKISSHDAERFGLVNKVVDKEKLGKEVNKIATELSKLAPGTMRLGLEAYNHQDKMDFDEAVPFLKEQLEKCLKSDDAKEGITAFLEKRDPEWK